MIPADRPAGAAGWCHLPQFPVLLKASCSWCTGPPCLDQQLPSGWYSWSSRPSELGPDANNTRTHTQPCVFHQAGSTRFESDFFYLSTGDVDGCYQVSRMGIKSSDAASHGRTHQVFVDVQLHQVSRLALQHLHTHRCDGLQVYASTLGPVP